MTTLKHFIGTALLLAASTAFAQTITTPFGDVINQDGPGVIGHRYLEAGGGMQLFNDSSASAVSGGINFNMPLTKSVDVSASYGHSYMEHHKVKYNGNSFSTSALWYSVIEGNIKPFIEGTLGYSFSRAKTRGWKNSSDAGYWSVTAGAEFPYKWVSVIPTLTYDDDFRNSNDSVQDYVIGVEVNSWINDRVGVYGEIDYINTFHNYQNSWFIGAGVRVKL